MSDSHLRILRRVSKSREAREMIGGVLTGILCPLNELQSSVSCDTLKLVSW